MKKKVDALLKMSVPSNQKQVGSILVAINFYRSMRPMRTHPLTPLTRLTPGQVPFNCDPACQEDAFDEMKAVLATDCLNMYAGLNKTLTVVCNASDYQLESCTLQD